MPDDQNSTTNTQPGGYPSPQPPYQDPYGVPETNTTYPDYDNPTPEPAQVDYQNTSFGGQGFDPYNATQPADQFDPYAQDVSPAPQQPQLDPYGQFGDYNQGFTSEPQLGQAVDTGYTDQNIAQAPFPQINESLPESTFEEKKSGNRFLLIVGVVVVVLLLAATGVLIYLNRQQAQNVDDNNNNSSQNADQGNNQNNNNQTPTPQTPPDSSLTGGPNTPATLALKSNETKVPKSWILQKFASPNRDNEGNCLNVIICGDQADADNDGLTTIEEYNFQTDPNLADTDRDGLADGNELYIYYTDPLKADSDNDTFPDGVEVVNCYDPITTGSAAKMNTSRLTQITTSTGLKPLKEPTISLLRNAKAVTGDYQKGFIESKCAPTTSESTQTQTQTNTQSQT